jgi:lysophospholipase L1-like esterase
VRRKRVIAWRRSLAGLLAGVGALTLVASMATGAAAADRVKDLNAVAFGDSVMLGAKSQLKNAGVGKVDAKVSRQAYTGPGLIRGLGSRLPEHVVVHLGTNGTYTMKMCKQLVRAAGKNRTVYLVNLKVPRSWEKVNNKMLRKCDAKFRSDRVVLLDWNELASNNPKYLYADGIHLRPEGAKAFATMVRKAITTPRAPYSDRLPLSPG